MIRTGYNRLETAGQNPFVPARTPATALKEYGALRRTVYAARYLSDPDYRRKISRRLNKGESLHTLRRDLLYAHEGMIRARQLDDQTE